MSKEDKARRAQEYLMKNDAILSKMKRMCRQYRHNHECAKNLYKKAQVPECEWPGDVKGEGWIDVTFD